MKPSELLKIKNMHIQVKLFLRLIAAINNHTSILAQSMANRQCFIAVRIIKSVIFLKLND